MKDLSKLPQLGSFKKENDSLTTHVSHTNGATLGGTFANQAPLTNTIVPFLITRKGMSINNRMS